MRVLALGTNSVIKIRAASRALEVARSRKKVEIAPRNVVVPINAQPVGEAETLRGSEARAILAMESAGPVATYGLGIENGIILQSGEWFDVAMVTLVWREGAVRLHLVVASRPLHVGTSLVEMAQAEGLDKVTWGDISARLYRHDPKDPHSYWTDGQTSREDFLVEALVPVFKRL